MKITVWIKLNNGVYEHNHIEEGHSFNQKPTPKFDSQKSWLNNQWLKKHAYLVNNKIVQNDKC